MSGTVEGFKHLENIDLINFFGHRLDTLSSPDQARFLGYVNDYKPEQTVHGHLETVEGLKLTITDTYQPPSQTGNASKLQYDHLPGGYIPREIDARAPCTAVWNFTMGGDPYGIDAEGHYFVEGFNKEGWLGSGQEINYPHPLVSQEWRRRMGISATQMEIFARTSSRKAPSITIEGRGEFVFTELHDRTGCGIEFNRTFTRADMLNMGYAVVLLAHYLDHIPAELQENGFWVSVHPGFGDAQYLLAVRKGANGYEVLTQRQQAEEMLKASLPTQDADILYATFQHSPHQLWSNLHALMDLEQIKGVNGKTLIAHLDAIQPLLYPVYSQEAAQRQTQLIADLKSGKLNDQDYYRFLASLQDFPQTRYYLMQNELMLKDDAVMPIAQARANSLTSVKVSFADYRASIDFPPRVIR